MLIFKGLCWSAIVFAVAGITYEKDKRACANNCSQLVNTLVASCRVRKCEIQRCAAGYTDCDKDAANGCEVETSSDPHNCGKCGKTCKVPKNGVAECSNGKCKVICLAGYNNCREKCIPVGSHSKCGVCDVDCNGGNTDKKVYFTHCEKGHCAIDQCKYNFADCDKDASNGCEADLTSNDNCGRCGHKCPVDNQCTNGKCVVINYLADNSNCGKRGHKCKSDSQCTEGVCIKAKYLNDPKNCGKSGNVCPIPYGTQDPTCNSGKCGFTCKTGFADCDNDPANGCEFQGDKENCPACIGIDQEVTVLNNNTIMTKMLGDLNKGDMVLTENGFSKYIGDMHGEHVISKTVIITLDDFRKIELTGDHLIQTSRGFIHADAVTTEDVLFSLSAKGAERDLVRRKVASISVGRSRSSSPLTKSGTIIVNGIVVSCYATINSHYAANFAFFPVRYGLVNNIQQYSSMLIDIRNTLPNILQNVFSLRKNPVSAPPSLLFGGPMS